jgi:hypothetical protein
MDAVLAMGFPSFGGCTSILSIDEEARGPAVLPGRYERSPQDEWRVTRVNGW